MEVYRFCLWKFAHSLTSGGRAGRWNSKDHFILYTASSRALAILENLVHMGEGQSREKFGKMVIEIPDDAKIESIEPHDMPSGWDKADLSSHLRCRPIGDTWYQSRSSLLFRVPSSLVPEEHNYLINTKHPDFGRLRIKSSEPVLGDHRLMQIFST
jgi:RES domain-containing protein